MTGCRALVGFSLLCALAFTAFSAPRASAATSGTTAVTCVPDATNHGDYTDAHCDTTGTKGASAFKHVAIIGETTGVISTNAATKNSTTEATKVTLESIIAGIITKLEATGASGTGTLENKLEGEVHRILGRGIVSTYTGVTVVNPPGCTVHSPGQPTGTIKSATLKAESVEGTPMTFKMLPESGTEFTILNFEGASCSINGINVTISGTIPSEPSGQMVSGTGVNSAGATATINVTKASAQLKVGGQNASLTATTTIKMSEGNPIASTGPPFP
jgi:hypothetical protein